MRIISLVVCASCWIQSTCLQPSLGGKPKIKAKSSVEQPIAANEDQIESTLSRRALFQGAASTCLSFGTLANPLYSVANAAAPITAAEADNFPSKAQRLLRPKPPKALRPKLNKDFAVLLMRSSYNALDQLDCVAMVCGVPVT